MINDQEVFRRSKHARWSVRVYDFAGLDPEAYAYHTRCHRSQSMAIARVSWSIDRQAGVPEYNIDEAPHCNGCGAKVPEYIQALVALYEDAL